jgi:hypothetical protein
MLDSWAAHGGTMEPDIEVMAARIFRSDDASPAQADALRLRHPTIHKAINRRFLIIDHLCYKLSE